MSDLEKSWTRAWSDLGVQSPSGLQDQLVAAYQEPQRHYHSLQHLIECLAHFDQVLGQAKCPGEVAIALWFHDAIYDVKGKSNEQQSADWAVSALSAAGADQATQDRVRQLIMATKHDAEASEPDQQLLVDIDLAILGAGPERFAEYDRQVRAEYSWVPGLVYNIKRKAVLKSFLGRKYIYSTKHFRELYEAQARSNLASLV
ncbi:MAG: N-methyl-D-aspartate receptor NMDAR2C subunit [Leptothrix sp. (in: Bacteria)]|nr:N-methyl-D-aspartate receptor NMDAR2C subunit [Leptothrix sp. (in: b-proteobacteria)]